MTTIDDVFSEKGILASHFGNYEMRQGQVELARAIQRSIGEGRSLVAEGPTGIGKSFSALVPSILALTGNVNKVTYATANIALQEQLIEKDLPALDRMLPVNFTYALLKGRNNYLCKDKMATALSVNALRNDSDSSYVINWSNSTQTGDKSELSIEYKKWGLISAGPGDCISSGCKFAGYCFANAARRQAEQAKIIVTNYHLLLRGGVPHHEVLVCDEAHNLEDIARGALGWKISWWNIDKVLYWVQKNKSSLSTQLFKTAQKVFGDVEEMLGRRETVTLTKPDWSEAVEDIVQDLVECSKLAAGVAASAIEKDKKARAEKALERINGITNQFIHARDVDVDTWVCWLSREYDRKTRTFHINGAPIIVSDLLPGLIYDEPASTIFVSATMTSGNSFEFIRSQLGVPDDAGELIAPSPFDLKNQGIIVVPHDAPPPNVYSKEDAEIFYDAVAESAKKLILLCHGKSLLLFTSWKSMDAVFQRLELESELDDFRIMKQGDAPRMHLIDEFKHDVDSVLLGVSSFWQGIDVPGEALTGLLIDKIPFSVPTDPVQVAVNSHLERRGGNPFFQRAIPQATIALSQGVGRLIRTKQDRGVVVIMDNRLIEKAYGAKIINSMPGLTKVRSFGQVDKFMAK